MNLRKYEKKMSYLNLKISLVTANRIFIAFIDEVELCNQ